MSAVDTNILVYAHRADSTFHQASRGLLASLRDDGQPWAITWATVHEFYSITTNQRIYKPASPPETALNQLSEWIESGVSILSESPTHFDTLTRLLRESGVTGGRVHDARIAAICIDHNVTELWTADRDFSRFTGLAIRNPLVNY